MIRGTFANVRLKNQLVPGVGWRTPLPTKSAPGEQMSIFASAKYQGDGAAHRDRGQRIRDGFFTRWAAKGVQLRRPRGIQKVLNAHRSNSGWCVFPSVFAGRVRKTLGLTGQDFSHQRIGGTTVVAEGCCE